MSVIGTWLVIIGLIIAAWQYRDIQGKEIALGKVTALEPYGNGGRSGQTYRVIASFFDQHGKPQSYSASFGVPSPGYEVGGTIRIYFERENPSNCGVVSFGYRFGLAWGFIVLGLSLWLFAVGWQFGNGWLENLFPTTVMPN
jgi:hypothetical protein